MKITTRATPTVLLLCLATIGSGAALAQQLGAIPIPVGANPAFIQTTPTTIDTQTVQPPQGTAPVAILQSSQTPSQATTPKPVAVKQDQAQRLSVNAASIPGEDKSKPATEGADKKTAATNESGASKGEVNPMTGKTADIETLTHDYEVEKLRASIATEKQKRMTAERSMNDSIMPPPPQSAKAPLAPIQQVGMQQTAPVVQTKPIKMPKTKPLPVMPMQPHLAGTMMQNGERYAIFEQGGETVVVKQGQTAFGQSVGKVSESGAILGGMMLAKQSADVMRLARNDISGTPTAGMQPGAMNGPLPAPLTGPSVNPTLPLTIPTQGQAPTNTAMMQPMGIPATGAGVGR